MNVDRHHQDSWPVSWANQHAYFMKRSRAIRDQYWSEPLVEMSDGLPRPLSFDHRVLAGMARKAAQVMRHTCTSCGRRGRTVRIGDRWAVQCGRCGGKAQLVEQIHVLASQLDAVSEFAPFGATMVWHEHDLSDLLRSAIPSHYWQSTHPPGQQPLRYLTRENVEVLMPWLRRLAAVIEDH